MSNSTEHLDPRLRAIVAQHGNALSEERSGKGKPHGHTARVHLAVDTMMSRQPDVPGKPIACKAGCDYCCHYRVYAYAPEVLAIAAHVQQWPDLKRDALVTRLQAYVQATASMTSEQHERANLPCAFLEQHRCSVYEVRPVACRKHHSLSAETCRQVCEHPEIGGDLERNALRMQASDGVVVPWVLALRREGLDFARYELGAAALKSIENQAAGRRFRDGKSAFPNARDVDATGGLPSGV